MAIYDESGQPVDEKVDTESSPNLNAGICELLASKYSDNEKLTQIARTVDSTIDNSVSQHGAAKVGMAVCLTGLLVSCCSAYMGSGSAAKRKSTVSNGNSSEGSAEVV